MKYYIPIHRDNIDNVIIAESIAPADYYPSRDYGYCYFKTLKDIPWRRWISLFENPVKMIGDYDMDEVAFVEIDGQNLSTYAIKSIDGGLLIDEPIALYPWSCRFLFQSDEALRQTVILCRSSLCNKNWCYYEFVLMDKLPSGKVQANIHNENTGTKLVDSEINAKLSAENRLKGFLYSYIMGRYVSLSTQMAFLLQTERKMYDIATVMTSIQSYERERFKTQLLDLESLFEKYDPNRIELQRRWREMIESRIEGTANQQAFETIVAELGGENEMKATLAQKTGLDIRQGKQAILANYVDWNQYKIEIDSYTQQHLSAFRIRKGDINTADDFTLDGIRVIFNKKYGDFFGLLITKVIEGIEWLNLENLRLHRLDIASELTRMMRDMKTANGQEWEGSEERIYLNELRQHIASGEQFDVTKTQDIILKSLAIFVLKGDDYEEMMRYIEFNAIADYRFVLGLWGACVGYANMPKTAIQRMHLDQQGEANIYLASHRLTGEASDGAIVTPHTYQFPKREVRPKALSHELLPALNDKSIGLTKAQKSSIMAIWEEQEGKVDETFYNRVSQVKGIGSIKLKNLQDALGGTPSDQSIIPDIFGQQSNAGERKFDISAWSFIEPILPNDPEVKDRVREDLKWFISHSRKNDTNRQHLINYRKHLMKKACPVNSKYNWSASFFKELEIDKIIAQLESIYL